MDRISDSGSDDYGSTPYGDTPSYPQDAFNQPLEDFSFNFTGKIQAFTLSQTFKTITYI